MGFITKYGKVDGQIPITGGRIFWVSPGDSYIAGGKAYEATDRNDGLSPNKALRTINAAALRTTEDAGDVIVLLPGTHTPTDEGTDDGGAVLRGVTITGMPSGRGNMLGQRSIVGPPSGAVFNQCLSLYGKCEVSNLGFIPKTAVRALITRAGSSVAIRNCYFDLETPVISVSTRGILLSGPNGLIENCYFASDGAQGAGILALNASASDCVIRDCVLACSAGTWAAAIEAYATALRLIVQDCMFQGSGTGLISDCIRGATGAGDGSLQAIRNIASVRTNDIVDAYDAGTAEIAENYTATVGGGAGFALETTTN